MDCLQTYLDYEKNKTGKGAYKISTESSKIQIWVVPTNEEGRIAKETRQVIEQTA